VRHLFGGGGHGDRGGHLLGHLAREARAGEGGKAGEELGGEDLVVDLGDGAQAVQLDPLGGGNDDGIRRQEGERITHDPAHQLRGDHAEHHGAAGVGLLEVVGNAQVFGELDAGEEQGVLPARAHLLNQLGLVGPKGDGVALLGQEVGQGGAPATGTYDGDDFGHRMDSLSKGCSRF